MSLRLTLTGRPLCCSKLIQELAALSPQCRIFNLLDAVLQITLDLVAFARLNENLCEKHFILIGHSFAVSKRRKQSTSYF
jgi:hypothetical protein